MEGLACILWGRKSVNSPAVGIIMKKYERMFLMQYEHHFRNSPIWINQLISRLLTDILSIAFLSYQGYR
jgi:hypothetical protein